MKIFIDNGHGGSDPGASGNGLIEKNLNLTVGLKLKELLLTYKDVQVKMSRENDTTVSLEARVAMADTWGADYFISIHHNASNGKADGYEVIHSIFHGKGEELAKVIALEFSKTGQNCRKIFSKANSTGKDDYYYVIRKPKATSIIIEYAFIDSKDYQAVDTTAELHNQANAICNALVQFLGLKKATSPLDEAIDYLNTRIDTTTKLPIIADKAYWKKNAVKDGKPNPEWVGSLIIKFANILKSK